MGWNHNQGFPGHEEILLSQYRECRQHGGGTLRDHLQERTALMTTMVSQYEVVELTPDERPVLEQVQHLLNTYACEGWEFVTAFRAEGLTPSPVDQTIRSLSHVTSSTLFIFKRPA
jgi:hypothetical protein